MYMFLISLLYTSSILGLNFLTFSTALSYQVAIFWVKNVKKRQLFSFDMGYNRKILSFSKRISSFEKRMITFHSVFCYKKSFVNRSELKRLERKWTGKNETHPYLQVNSAISTQPSFCSYVWKNRSIVLSCYSRFESEKNWKML